MYSFMKVAILPVNCENRMSGMKFAGVGVIEDVELKPQ
jgi:hypothetical protein